MPAAPSGSGAYTSQRISHTSSSSSRYQYSIRHSTPAGPKLASRSSAGPSGRRSGSSVTDLDYLAASDVPTVCVSGRCAVPGPSPPPVATLALGGVGGMLLIGLVVWAVRKRRAA